MTNLKIHLSSLFAPLFAFRDLHFEKDWPDLNPQFFLFGTVWLIEFLILNLIRNKIHLIGQATSATLVNDHIHQWDTRVTSQVW